MVKLPHSLYQAMKIAALRAYPHETCGLLGGRNRLLVSWYPLPNVAPQPRRIYSIAPPDLFRTMKHMRRRGETEMGIFHSHPTSAAIPSPTDIAFAFYPEAIYFILGFSPTIHLRAYSIVHQQVTPIEICVVA